MSQPEGPLVSRPRHWYGTRVARFVMLLVALATLLLLPIHLTPTGALVVGIVGFAGTVLLAFTGVRRVLTSLQARASEEISVLGRSAPRSAVRRDMGRD